MWKKRLLLVGLLAGWGVVKANTPGGCTQCCVLEGRCLLPPAEPTVAEDAAFVWPPWFNNDLSSPFMPENDHDAAAHADL